jgi:hypothetical protein
MKQWISKFFLFAALLLVLMHNIVAHHHADEKGHGFRDNHHNVLERVRMDHVFYTDYTFNNYLEATIPDLVFGYGYAILPLTVKITPPAVLPDEPYPPGWITDQTVLRGPPVNC